MSGSKRISELPITTAPSGNDRVVVLTNPASSAQTQTTTITSLTNNLRYANTTVSGVVKVGNNLSINATGFLNASVGGNVVFTEYVAPWDTSYPLITTANDRELLLQSNNGVSLGSNDYVQMVASSNGTPFGSGNSQSYVWVNPTYVGNYIQDDENNYWVEKDLRANGMLQWYGATNTYSYGFSISPNDGYGINIQPHDSYNNILTILPTGDHDIHLFESGTGGAITLGDYGQSHISVYGPGGNDTEGTGNNEILIHLINNAALTIVTNDTNYEWKFAANGILTLPNTSGDIFRDGASVLTAPVFLAPNIAYTGVFNGYPASLPVTKGQAVFFTGNNYVLETANKYWLATRFDTGDYDLSGTETLDFNNIGGIMSYFRLGGKSETLLTNTNLHDITVVTDYFYIRDLPALETFSANNLSYIGNYFQIDTMDNANTQFNFPNLKTINGNFYYTYNNTLENTPQFPALETVNGSFYIYYNSAIQNTMTFDSLRYVDYAAIYQNGGMVAGPIFPALTSMGYLDMQNNDYMIDPPQFPVLETMTSSFYFYGHDLVTTAPALPSLTTCGYIGIYQNPVMDGGFNFSALTHVTNTLNISENIALTTAPAFPALVEVNGALLIENNSNLVNGFSFPALKRVDGNVSMANCSLDETSVNYILMLLASLDGTGGTTSYDGHVVNLSGGSNAVPTGDGLTAIATLEARGCTVYYNTP